MIEWDEIQISLNSGELAILPTETVYGLAGNALIPAAIDAIYAAKGRDFNKPLAVVVPDLEVAELLAHFNDVARHLATQYWPGPLTLVLDAKPNIPLDPRTMSSAQGKTTIALRCPDVEWRTKLNGPLALTSANQSGQSDKTTMDDVETLPGAFFDNIQWSVESNSPMSGKATTIIRVSGDDIHVLRQGELDISV
jgi:L-threonylcarbamoyladenylate synthase